MTKFVWVVGRRVGGGYKVTELCVMRCSADMLVQDRECREAAVEWCKKNALELKMLEVMP